MTDIQIRSRIFKLLAQRKEGATICPSEVLPPSLRSNRKRMEAVREVAKKLAALGEIEITQKEHAIDPSQIKGPIRLRLVKSS